MPDYKVTMVRSPNVSEVEAARRLAIVYDLLFDRARKAEQPDPPAEDGEEPEGPD